MQPTSNAGRQRERPRPATCTHTCMCTCTHTHVRAAGACTREVPRSTQAAARAARCTGRQRRARGAAQHTRVHTRETATREAPQPRQARFGRRAPRRSARRRARHLPAMPCQCIRSFAMPCSSAALAPTWQAWRRTSSVSQHLGPLPGCGAARWRRACDRACVCRGPAKKFCAQRLHKRGPITVIPALISDLRNQLCRPAGSAL